MKAGLAPEVRQIVYSFLPMADLVKVVSKLSKVERELLERSAIARKDRSFKVEIPKCVVGHFSNSYEVMTMSQLAPVLPLVEKLEITIRPPESYKSKLGF